MRHQVCALVFAGAALVASPALAGDGGCLWNALPEPDRDQLIAFSVQSETIPTPERVGVLEDKGVGAAAMFKACHIDGANATAATTALAGYMISEIAIGVLEKTHVATRVQLTTGWDTMDGTLRRGLIQNAAEQSKEPLSADAINDFAAHTGVAGLPQRIPNDESVRNHLMLYLLARALIAANEPKF
jgi:hypothetical protein